MVEFAVLGPLEVTGGDQRVILGGAKERALLALLLIEPNQVVSVDCLVEDLWEGDPPESASVSLRVLVSRLRKALATVDGADAVVTRAPGYLLNVDTAAVDATRFESLVERGRAELAVGHATAAATTLRDALGLWRGRAFAEVADAPWARAEAARLEEARLSAVEERVDADLACGRHSVLVGELEALCAAHPLSERLWSQRMVALYRSGRQADALRAYQDLRATLADELGLDPTPELATLEQRILTHDPALSWPDAGPADPLAAPRSALPTGVVSFLLTDIEGSTALWDTNHDAMAATLERHDTIITEVVHAAGGQVLKSKGEGDALLAVFPRASDAVTAALEAQAALGREHWPGELTLRVRMAIHTGEAHERDDDYFGPTLNRAARIRSLATGGQVLVSRATADIVRDRLADDIALLDRGQHELRGLARDEQVFELVARVASTEDHLQEAGLLELPLPPAVANAASGFFVGRDEAIADLDGMWQDVLRGDRRTALLAGEPGIGKTRLACEFARHIDDQGAVVLFGRCDEDLGMPYQPFAEALAAFAASCPPERLTPLLGEFGGELCRLVPELIQRCPTLRPPLRADPETERHRLFEAVNGWLVAVARHAPVAVVVDDLHWAAKPTLAMLRHLARGTDPAKILLLGTYRPTDLDRAHPLTDTLADLRRETGVHRVAVRGLDVGASVAFVEASGGQPLEQREVDLAEALHALTNGNPFFMSEVLRHLVETGALQRLDDRWITAVDRIEDAGLPEGIREVIGRRLNRLSPAANRMLDVASVVGATFSLALLERVPEATIEKGSLPDAIDEAVRAGTVVEDGRSYAFAHALIRQTVYAELPSARRTRLHRLVGEAIESLPDADGHIEALAHHFAEAALDGQVNKAADYGLAAGRRALAGLAHEAAVVSFERALSVIELDSTPQPARRAALLYSLAISRWALGERERARDAAFAAAGVARGLDEPDLLARSAILLTALGTVDSNDGGPADVCRDALARLGPEPPGLRIRVMAALARYQAFSLGEDREAEQLAGEALALAREAGGGAVLMSALNAQIVALGNTGRAEEQLVLAGEVVNLAEDSGDPRNLADGLLARARARFILGDVIGFDADTDALARLGEDQHWWMPSAASAGLRLTRAVSDGRFTDAEQVDEVRADAGDDIDVVTALRAHLGALRYHQGRSSEFVALVRDQLSDSPAIADDLPRVLAYSLAARGEHKEARLLITRLADSAHIGGTAGARQLTLGLLAEACALVGHPEPDQRIRAALHLFQGRLLARALTSGTSTLGAADRFLGMLAATESRWDEAEAHYRNALELETRVESPVFVAETSLWYGRMLLERDAIGDRERGVELILDALTTADDLGMAWVAQEARRLLRPPLPVALRPREGTTFVGRAAELDRLTAQWNDVQAGARRLLLVAGEPGIGKTRLAGELAAQAHAQNATVLYGRCDEDAGAAYQPFAEALRAYAASCPPDELTAHVDRFGGELARLVPELARRVPDLPDLSTADPESERLRLFDAVTALLATASVRAPVVLVLDDLHWATKPTLLLLRHILRSSEPMRVLLIGTYRDTDLDRSHPLADSLAGLQREATEVERLALRGLAADEVAAYVEAMGGQSLGDDEIALARAVHAETEGNPFFVTEVLRHVVETGLAYREDGRWVLKARRVEDLGLPEGVRDVISQRLSRQSEGANQALAVAAVIGPTFSLAVLERVPDAPSGDGDLLDALDDALNAGIIIDAGRSTYAFAHALIRQTLYTELSSARRTRLHRRIGEAIEGLPDADRHVDALAHHFAEAAIDGQAAKAASYSLSAGWAAMERLACEEAVSVFERGLAALDLDGSGDLAMRAELLVALADARQVAGDLEGSRAVALEAATIARTLGSSDRLATVAAILTRESPVGLADPTAAAVCEEALLGLGDHERSLRARVMASLARHRTWTAAGGGVELAAQAIELARQIDDPRTLAAVLSNAGQALSGSPRAEEELSIAAEVVAIARDLGDSRQLAEGLGLRATAKLALGDIDGFDADSAELAELATTLRSWFHMSLGLSMQALRAAIDGRFDEAESLVAEMMTHGGHDPAVVNFQVGHLLSLRFEQGRHAELIPFVSAFHNDERPALVGLRAYLSLACAQAGETDQAKALLDALVTDDLAVVPRDVTWPVALSLLAETSALLADAHSASAIYPSLRPFVGQLVHVGRAACFGAADRQLGMLAAVLGRLDEAEAHYLAATALAERIGSRPFLARTRMWHAKLLLARDEAGDCERAIELLEQSAATAGELGMQAVAAETTSLLSSQLS